MVSSTTIASEVVWGRPGVSVRACPRPSYWGPVSVWLAVSRCAGDGVGRFAVAGVAVQLRGGSAIFGSGSNFVKVTVDVSRRPPLRPGHGTSAPRTPALSDGKIKINL